MHGHVRVIQCHPGVPVSQGKAELHHRLGWIQHRKQELFVGFVLGSAQASGEATLFWQVSTRSVWPEHRLRCTSTCQYFSWFEEKGIAWSEPSRTVRSQLWWMRIVDVHSSHLQLDVLAHASSEQSFMAFRLALFSTESKAEHRIYCLLETPSDVRTCTVYLQMASGSFGAPAATSCQDGRDTQPYSGNHLHLPLCVVPLYTTRTSDGLLRRRTYVEGEVPEEHRWEDETVREFGVGPGSKLKGQRRTGLGVSSRELDALGPGADAGPNAAQKVYLSRRIACMARGDRTK